MHQLQNTESEEFINLLFTPLRLRKIVVRIQHECEGPRNEKNTSHPNRQRGGVAKVKDRM